jgi:DNA-binding response OmpR family regulator
VSHKILIIDDSPLVLELTRHALMDEGFDVSVATTLDEFEALRVAQPPDLILVDVQMPEAFGDDLTALLRGAYSVKVPIFLLSSLADDELAERAKAAEATGFISKRAGLEKLVALVHAAVGREAD